MDQENVFAFVIALLSGVIGGTIVTLLGYFLDKKRRDLEIIKLRREIEILSQAIKSKVILPAIRELDACPTFVDKRFQASLSSDFLASQKGTVLIWIKVPEPNVGIRSLDQNKYMLAHHTGGLKDSSIELFHNRFSFSHSFQNNNWTVTFSGENGKEKHVHIKDDLDIGWHHFLILWDRRQSKVELIIDGGQTKKEFIQDITDYWPQGLSGKVTIGTWVNRSEMFFCNAWLYRLEIYTDYLKLNQPEVQAHLNDRPI